MNHVICGYGEIGQAVYEIIESEKDVTIAVIDPKVQNDVLESVDIMHICFPYELGFVADVLGYVKEFKPEHIIIYSTTPIGITKKIKGAVHSPVEGKHPDLALSIRQMERWIGFNDREEGQFFRNFFHDLGLRTRLIENTDFSEVLKLLSTSEYGINIAFADYKAEVAEKIGMDFELTKEWNREYNKLYRNLGEEKRFQKYVLDAPNGRIGGHCVTQNAELLNDDYPDELLDVIIEMRDDNA